MYINQITPGSEATLTVGIENRVLEFTTIVKEVFSQPYKKGVYFCGCELIERNGKRISFGSMLVSALVKNAEDGREYKYPACALSFNKDKTMLLIFSHYDVPPVNHRSAYRVPCSFHTVVQIGNNKKAIDGHLHDISYSGIGMSFLSEEFKNLQNGQFVSASIFDHEEHVYKVTGQVVRFIEEFSAGRTLVGIQFIEPGNAIAALVSNLQRRELKLRKENQ